MFVGYKDYVDLSFSFFIGSIPESFGNLRMITYLYLQHNSFDGMIPYSFIEMSSLVVLDLSSNNLLGMIPVFLVNFTDLVTLNLSFNKLDGKIPDGGIFSNITSQSLIGNAGLCGTLRLGFSPCVEKHQSHNRPFLKYLLAAVTVAVASVVLCALLITRI